MLAFSRFKRVTFRKWTEIKYTTKLNQRYGVELTWTRIKAIVEQQIVIIEIIMQSIAYKTIETGVR